MSQMITLILPEGAWDYPSSHGTTEYYPYPLRIDSTRYPARENATLWAIDVPIEIYHHFIGRPGYRVYEPADPAEIIPFQRKQG